jgi:hypothetical protein
VADRKTQFDTMMRAHALFGDMSKLTDQIEAARAAVAEREKALPAGDALAAKLRAVAAKLDETKKLVVATTEGGAITGEERIREHLATLYGAINGWEGRPTKYQTDYLDALRHELTDAAKALEVILTKDARALDDELKSHKLTPIPALSALQPPAPVDQLAQRCVASWGRDCGDSGDRAARQGEHD